MNDGSNNLNLTTLKEMLLDEHKLVTYISLSKDLCIHVNQSKLLLETAVNEIKKEKSDVSLNVNYILSGLLENNKVQVVICNESDLVQCQAKFKKIYFQHLYSVRLGNESSVLDKVSLLAVNKFDDIPLCSGILKNSSCIKRLPDEIFNLKTQSHQLITSEPKVDLKVGKKAKIDNFTENSTTNSNIAIKIEVTNSKLDSKTETLPKKESLNVKQPVHKNENKPQKGIASFFNKASGPKVKKKIEEMKSMNNQKKNSSVKTEKMDVDNVSDNNENTYNNEQFSDETTKKLNKSLDQIKKNSKVDKKRKRVLHVSDSDSGEENDPFKEEPQTAIESDDEIPPTPLANTVKITSGIVNPKKKRKIVDKTYTGEDGYIWTKKVEVYESCSENEEEVCAKENVQNITNKTEVSPNEKKISKLTKKKISSPQKGKQALIMNFFKKK